MPRHRSSVTNSIIVYFQQSLGSDSFVTGSFKNSEQERKKGGGRNNPVVCLPRLSLLRPSGAQLTLEVPQRPAGVLAHPVTAPLCFCSCFLWRASFGVKSDSYLCYVGRVCATCRSCCIQCIFYCSSVSPPTIPFCDASCSMCALPASSQFTAPDTSRPQGAEWTRHCCLHWCLPPVGSKDPNPA